MLLAVMMNHNRIGVAVTVVIRILQEKSFILVCVMNRKLQKIFQKLVISELD